MSARTMLTPTRLRRLTEALVVAALAVFGLLFAWIVGSDELTDTEVGLLREMALVGMVSVLVAVAIMTLFEVGGPIQRLTQHSSDEHKISVGWWGKRHQSGAEGSVADVESIRADPTALALYLGSIAQASAIRSVGRYLLVAVIILASVWAFQPFAASLV